MKELSKYSFLQRSLIFLLTIAAYTCIGYGGLGLATLNVNSSPIWFSSGLAVGSLLLFGNRLAPAIFIGALFTNLLVDTPWLPLICIAYGNTLEALLGAKLVRWVLRKNYLKSYTELFAVILCALFPPIVSSVIGVNALAAYNGTEAGNVFYTIFTWWSGDAIGIMVVLPIFLEVFLTGKKRDFPGPFNIFTGLLVTFLLFWINWLVFFEGYNQAFTWILGPALLVLSFVVGPVYSRLTLIALSTTTVFLTMKGLSLFEFGDLNLNLIYTQCILASFALAVLFYRPYSVPLKHSLRFILANMLGWSCCFGTIYYLSNLEKIRLKEEFNVSIQEVVDDIKDSETQLAILLEGSKAYLRLHPDVSANDWKEYFESLNLGNILKVISGLGVIYPYDKSEKLSLPVTVIDEDYSRNFNDRLVVTLVEPLGRNIKAVGVDIGSERIRRSAALLAKVSNKTISTTPVYLAQRSFKEPGFIIFHPIRGKKKEFLGWTYMPIFYQGFFSNIFNPGSDFLKINVNFQGKQYFSNENNADGFFKNPHFIINKNITIFDVDYSVEFYPSEAFLQRHYGSTPAIAMFLSVFIYFFASFILELITFNQRSEELVEKKTKELDSSRMKLIYNSKMASLGEMASGMAHEINNPLAAILVKLEVLKVMMKEEGNESTGVTSEVEKIKTIVGRISKIVSGLRTFSRSSQLDPFEPVVLKQVLNETLELCGEKLKDKGISLQLKEVPDVLLICKPGQISQVILNLLNNSSDAIEGTDDKWIIVDFKSFEGRIQIRITDSGLGISSAIAAKIMDPFFTTKDPNKGTGLGLSISRGIVEDHQGRLWLDMAHKHTRFILELPTMNLKELGDV